MFKGRVWLWAIILACCFVVQLLITYVPIWFSSDDLTVQVDVSTDNDLGSVLISQKTNGFNLFLQSEDTDMIISDSAFENLEGYTRHEGFLSSPLVLYVCGLTNHNDGFMKAPDSGNCYKVDLSSILLAMEKDAEWESLGIDKRVANGKVTLYIPRETVAYYDEVVELFYLTLNNGKTPTETERNALKNRVDALLLKCNKVSNILQSIYNEYRDPSKTHKVFIGPEYLWRRGYDGAMASGSSKAFRPVYFLNTVYLTADLYTKNTADKNLNFAEKFVDKIKNKKNFMILTGWRVKDSTVSATKISSVYVVDP